MIKPSVVLVAGIGAGLAILAIVAAISFSPSASAQNTSQGNNTTSTQDDNQPPSFIYKLNKKFYHYENGVFEVKAGAGGYTGPMTVFFPSNAEIKVGDKVRFYNPTHVGEPHTVTFIFDNNSFADFSVPFVVGTNTTFTPPNPAANAEPMTVPGPGGKTMIIANNNRSFSPSVVDSQGKVTYLPPNANYTLTGTEKYVNSGWMWPKGMAPPGLAPIDSFTVTFSNAGTYHYMCVIHPWMDGTVKVQ